MFWGLLFGICFSCVFGIAMAAGIGALMGKITKSGSTKGSDRSANGHAGDVSVLMIAKVPPTSRRGHEQVRGTVLTTSCRRRTRRLSRMRERHRRRPVGAEARPGRTHPSGGEAGPGRRRPILIIVDPLEETSFQGRRRDRIRGVGPLRASRTASPKSRGETRGRERHCRDASPSTT